MFHQKFAKKNGKLREDREKLLNEIDFYWNSNDYEWDMHYDDIVEIRKECGHADIPSLKSQQNESNKVYAGYMAWVEEQRLWYALYKKEHHATITERRTQKLDAIGFAWFQDENDKTCIERKAKDTNFKWDIRNCLRKWSGFQQIMGAINKAKEGHATTGEPTVAKFHPYILL